MVVNLPGERRSGLTRWEALCVHGATVAVTGTGLVYGVMRHLLRPQDPFAIVSHPWQPAVQHLHVLAAPLLVFAAGLAWHAHARPFARRSAGPRRTSGWVQLTTLVPMVVSGYLLQVSVDAGWRTAWTVVHMAAALLWLVAYLGHQFGKRNGEGEPAVRR